MRPELTSKQQQFLKYLEEVVGAQGKTPSLRQAAQEFGVSHAAVAQLLHALEEKGYVRREGRYSRTIQRYRPLMHTVSQAVDWLVSPQVSAQLE